MMDKAQSQAHSLKGTLPHVSPIFKHAYFTQTWFPQSFSGLHSVLEDGSDEQSRWV